MNKQQKLFFAIYCLLFSLVMGLDAETSKDEKNKNRIIAAPLIFYTPETKMAFGVAGSYIFRLSKNIKNIRPSTISPLIIYTLNKQFKAQIKTDMFFENNNYRLISFINTQKYPDKFFGIGNNTQEENQEAFSANSTLFTLSIQKKIIPGLNIGVEYKYMNWTIQETEAGGKLDAGDLPGSDGGVISGIGLMFTLDTRDNIFSTSSGNYFGFTAKTFNSFLGSDFTYTDIVLDIRKFFPVSSSQVLAFQTKLAVQNGEVPFNALSKIGGEFNMRGYYQGRYRDKNMLLFQAEYRRHLFWRFGLVGFVGLGTVAEKFKELNPGEMKLSYGMGLRFAFDKKEKIQLRIDFGFGEDGSGFYFSIFEAF